MLVRRRWRPPPFSSGSWQRQLLSISGDWCSGASGRRRGRCEQWEAAGLVGGGRSSGVRGAVGVRQDDGSSGVRGEEEGLARGGRGMDAAV
jgi:hypothetical protein